MKKLYYGIATLLATIATLYSAIAQPAFSYSDVIDVNNIKAATLVHGDLWWKPQTQLPACEFPKNSGKNIMGAASIWMAGYDNNNALHQSAQTYRQSGNDYWPGPLDAAGQVDYPTSAKWAKIWKVNVSEINSFKALTNHTIQNTPAPILEWPAKNNPYAAGAANAPLTVTTDMAPFIDVNTDGNYNPLDGDYPDIKGDQMLWWVFSDNGHTHNNASPASTPLKVEIHAKAYGYKRNTLVDNVVYYEMDIANKSGNDYSGFRFGIWSDADLGYSHDDFVGFDSVHRMGIIYNGNATDGTGQPEAYATQIPVAGVTFLKMPGDNAPNYLPAGSFMSYDNNSSIIGNPISDSDYNNYLRSLWKNGSHLKNDYMGPNINSKGYGSGYDANYIFPGNPANKTEWSECASNNLPGDRRFVIATNDYNFAAGTTATVAFALVATQPGNTGCPNTSFTDIKIVADTAWKAFGHPLPTSVGNIANAVSQLHIYPNPVHDVLFINGSVDKVQVYDALGRSHTIAARLQDGHTELNVAQLPAGVYHLVASGAEGHTTQTFIKD